MRDFRLQSLVNCYKILKNKEMSWWDLALYVWLWITPTLSKTVEANKMYDRWDIAKMRKLLIKLGSKDPQWFPRLFEPTTLGIRSWEYGLLLTKVSLRGKKVLDVGAGNSRLPQYLSKIGAKVTMLDMENPLEDTEKKRDKNLNFVLGDMTNLSFRDKSFDRVICISAIEHVDMKKSGFYKKEEYEDRAIKAIGEMARVLKKKGVFYLTTDFYLPEQRSDKWVGSKDGVIRGAFEWRMADEFIKMMKSSGIKLANKPKIDSGILKRSGSRANYRGRYFTTIAFMGRKV